MQHIFQLWLGSLSSTQLSLEAQTSWNAMKIHYFAFAMLNISFENLL